MVGPNVGRTGNNKVGQKTQVSRYEQLQLDKQSEVLQQLGLNDPGQLPERARDLLDQVLAKGAIDKVDAGKTAVQLKNAIGKDFARSIQPGAAPDASVKLPDKGTIPLAKENGDGTFKLVGAAAGKDSPIPDLMSKLGIDAHNMGPNVARVLEGARGAELGKGNDKNWDRFARKLAEAKVKDTPASDVGKLTGLGAVSTSAAATAAQAVTTTQAADLGLNKQALTEDQKRGVDATTTPDAIRNTEALQTPGAKGNREIAVQQMQSVLQDAGLTKEQAKELQPLLDKVLKQGQLTAKTEVDKSWAIVKSASREITGKAMPRDVGTAPEGAAAESGAALVAASQIMDMASAKTGVALDSSRLMDMQAIVRGYSKAGAAKMKSKAGKKDDGIKFGSEKARAEAGKSKNDKTMPEAKAAAHEACRNLGVDPSDTTVSHTVADVERAFHKCMNGAKSDGEIAMRGLKWLERESGDKTGAMSKHLSAVLAANPDNAEVQKMAKEFAMQKVALCAAVGPEAYKAHMAAQMAGGGGVPGMPGGPGVPGMGGPGMPYGTSDEMLGPMRGMMGNAILFDPSLSHEDKIALFLMFLMQSQDQDRMRKMQELADLEQKEGAKATAADTKVDGEAEVDKATQVDSAKEAADAAKSVKSGSTQTPKNGAAKQNASTNTPPANDTTTQQTRGAAEQRSAEQRAAAGDNPALNNGQAIDPNATQAQLQDDGTGVGAKSKEILISELERMDKIRDMMVQSLMEIMKKKDQTTKDIMRG